MVTYLAFDPGHTTGFAEFDKEGNVTLTGQLVGLEALSRYLNSVERPEVVIYEQYRVRGDAKGIKANVGSRLETVQAIGVIKARCFVWDTPYIEQQSQIKAIAEMWSKVKPVGAHKNSHWVDAYNHGIYFLVKNKIRSITGIEDFSGKAKGSKE